MEDQRHQWAKELFADALERPPAERALFLAEACGDDAELRRQVEEWLASNEAADGFLNSLPERPVDQNPHDPEAGGVASVISFPELSERTGRKIGPYKLLQLIGEGGFGAV